MLGRAVVAILSSRRSATVTDVLEEIWEKYVAPGRLTIRVFRHPSGELWSPDLDEALKILEAAGVLERRGSLVVCRGC